MVMKWILKSSVAFSLGVLGCQPSQPGGFSAMRHDSWEAFEQRNHESLAEGISVATLPSTSDLRDCQLYAAQHNLKLQMSFYRWQASLENVPQAEALPNPTMSYSYFFERVETRTGSQRQGITLQQTFPAWGKIQSRTDAASAMATASWQEFQGMKFVVFARVQKEWGNLYYAQKEVALTQDQLALLEQFEPILLRRYRTSQAVQADLLRLQVDIEKVRDRLLSLRKRLVPLQASLNRVLGRPVSLPIRAESLPKQYPVKLDEPKARVAVTKQNPYLLASRMKLRAAEENIKLARAARLPDVSVGVTWIDTAGRGGPNASTDDGNDPLIGTVTLSLPIWFEAIEAGIRQAKHRRNEVNKDYHAQLLDSLTTLEEVLFRLKNAQRREALYRDVLVPKATESWKVTQRQYINGLADYNDMIETLQALLEFELARERVKVNHLEATAELQELTTLSIKELALPESSQTPTSILPVNEPTKPEPPH